MCGECALRQTNYNDYAPYLPRVYFGSDSALTNFSQNGPGKITSTLSSILRNQANGKQKTLTLKKR